MNRSTPEILEEHYTITSADTDFTMKLNTSSLVNMFIQSAWHHAETLGFGIDFLHKNETVWMLARLQVKMADTPSWNEKLILKTWPKGIHRVFYQRDFEISDKNDQKIALGTSEWLIIDLKAKRPKLFHTEHHMFHADVVKHAIETVVPVLDTPEMTPEIFSRKVNYSDVDLNRHLTSTRYIDWMFDTFDLDYLGTHKCSEIIINFIREIPFGAEVILSRFPIEESGQYVFEFSNVETEVLCFRGKLAF